MGHTPTPFLSHVAALTRAAVELALPTSCGGCGAATAAWCLSCAQELTVATGLGATRAAPIPCPPGLPPTWSGAPYRGVLRAALLAYKDRERRDLDRVLAPLLARAVAAAWREWRPCATPVLLVPTPSTPSARRRRGDQPLERLALAALAALADLDRGARAAFVWAPALTARRGVVDQAGLGSAARQANVADAFEARRGAARLIEGRDCLIVDDVMTTGATLAEVSRALRRAGAATLAAATVAHTPRRGPGPLHALGTCGAARTGGGDLVGVKA